MPHLHLWALTTTTPYIEGRTLLAHKETNCRNGTVSTNRSSRLPHSAYSSQARNCSTALTSTGIDVGHCPAACSYRCILHAPPQPSDVTSNDPLQKQKRHHRRKARPKLVVSDGTGSSVPLSPQLSSPVRGNERLEKAREELLCGNVNLARQLVQEELERLSCV